MSGDVLSPAEELMAAAEALMAGWDAGYGHTRLEPLFDRLAAALKALPGKS